MYPWSCHDRCTFDFERRLDDEETLQRVLAMTDTMGVRMKLAFQTTSRPIVSHYLEEHPTRLWLYPLESLL
jgi:hypothetical protein